MRNIANDIQFFDSKNVTIKSSVTETYAKSKQYTIKIQVMV